MGFLYPDPQKKRKERARPRWVWRNEKHGPLVGDFLFPVGEEVPEPEESSSPQNSVHSPNGTVGSLSPRIEVGGLDMLQRDRNSPQPQQKQTAVQERPEMEPPIWCISG